MADRRCVFRVRARLRVLGRERDDRASCGTPRLTLRGHGGISFSWHLGVLVISDIGPIIFRHHEPTNLKTTFAILGLIGFLASAIAHVVTFFGIDPSILCSVDLGASCRNICRFITLSKEDCST